MLGMDKDLYAGMAQGGGGSSNGKFTGGKALVQPVRAASFTCFN